MPDAPDVVIQLEERYEAMGEPGPYMVMEVDENGAVLTTAYFADQKEAQEQAKALAGGGVVQDDTKGAK